MNESLHTRKSLLLRASNPDDHEAFEEFVYYYEKFIFMILRKLGVDHTQLNDVQQELLLKLWKNLSKFKLDHERSSFRGWLCVIIRNEVSAYFKKFNKKNKIDTSTLLDESHESELDAIIEEEWMSYITTIAIKKMESHFDGNAMKVFQLVLDGYTISQIAQKLDLKESSTYVIRTRVKAKFQTEIRRIRSLLEF